MLTLYHGSGAQDFEMLEESLNDQDRELVILNAKRLLHARGEKDAVGYLERARFSVYSGSNYFNDEFEVLYADVPLSVYEDCRILSRRPEARRAFSEIAEVLTELGHCIRFVAVSPKLTTPENWDVFICHAGEDKPGIVKPLYTHLESRGIKCWYDQAEVLWGDSLVAKLPEGLRCSRFVIVVCSLALLRKAVPTREASASLWQEIRSGITKVLPLMVGGDDDIQQIVNAFPLLAEKRYLRWSGEPQEVENELRGLFRRENLK